MEEEGIPFSPKPNFGIISATLIWMTSLLVTPDEESRGRNTGGVEESEDEHLRVGNRGRRGGGGGPREGSEGHQKESLWKSGGG